MNRDHFAAHKIEHNFMKSACTWAWSIKHVANVWQNCIEVNGEAGPVVSTVLALPMPPWKRCSKFLEH